MIVITVFHYAIADLAKMEGVTWLISELCHCKGNSRLGKLYWSMWEEEIPNNVNPCNLFVERR